MGIYVILTRFTPQTDTRPDGFRRLAGEVAARIKQECPAVRWKESFSTAGSSDVVDIVESDEPAEVQRAAMLIRGLAHADTETMAATPWDRFVQAG